MHSPDVTAIFDLPDEGATQAFAALLASRVSGGRVIYLEGDLGAGKTTLVRALLRALGFEGPVKSPTYSLVEVYVFSSLYLYHFDFYRFASPEEFLDAGFSEYFNENAICFVEWPARAEGCVPPPDLRLRIHHAAAGRLLEAVAQTPEGSQCIKALVSTWDGGISSVMPAHP